MLTLAFQSGSAVPLPNQPTNDRLVQQGSANTAFANSIRNVTPITEIISHLGKSAPKVGDACHLVGSLSADVLCVEKEELIRFYRRKTGNGFFFVIRHPDDLDHHPLRRLDSYSAPGKKTERRGLIYQSMPITLIFDCDSLKPRQLASLNELFENPPRLDGKPISSTVSRVVVARSNLICQSDAPGPDFWRRVFALNSPSSTVWNFVPPLNKVIFQPVRHRRQPPESGTVQIRCPGQDVFATLFGNLAIDSDGKQYFRAGVISQQPDPVTICLVDPPDPRSPLWQRLFDVLEQGYFIANGERVELPPALQLEQYCTPQKDIDAFRQRINDTQVKPDKTCGVINTHNFEAVFRDLSVRDNTLQQVDTFANMASEFDQLLITGELTDYQWRILKQRTELLPVTPALVTGTLQEPSGDSVVRLHGSEAADVPTNDRYYLATGQQWEDLWFTNQLKLSGQMSFLLNKSPLLEKLLAGDVVVLTGLEHAPVLAGHMESLLAPEPYLWIYGQKIALPNCRVHIVWPSDHLPGRGPWLARWQQQDLGRRGSTGGVESVMAHYPDAVRPLTLLLNSIRTLPQSCDKSYPVIPVQTPSEFLKLLESQLHTERRLDHCETLEPFHWRKALNRLLAHPVRGDVTVYSFVKAQISAQFPDPEAAVDRDGIADLLKTLPVPRQRDDLVDNFWPLARYMVPALADCLPATFCLPEACSVAKMAAIIQSTLPEEAVDADDLPVLDNIHSYHGNRWRLLYDALLVGNDHVIPVHQHATVLNHQLSIIAQCHPSDPAPQLQRHLQQQFQHCSEQLQRLTTDWLKASRCHEQQQAKRLEQLTAMLKQHKVIELNGPAGSGKSCLALATGQALQEQQGSSMNWLVAALSVQLGWQPVKNLTLGPDTTWEDLYGSVTLKKNWFGHLVSHSVPGQLSDWASRSWSGLLIINEANLVRRGLLSPLVVGLQQSPPRLCVNGQTIWLTDNHRVLLTGNPESYQGRNLDPEVKSRVLRLYYRPLPQSILKQAIIGPLLPDGWPMERKATASDTILSVLAEYKKLLSEDYELTPRDLQDIMARFRLVAADAPRPNSGEEVFALADEACRQSLGGRIDPDKQLEWHALGAYWGISGRMDSHLLDRHQETFDRFFSQLVQLNKKQSQPLVIDTPPAREYIKTCWQFLQLREPGRVAMVVEGAAGWGKDVLLLLTLRTWQQQTGKSYQHLNGAPDQFAQFVQAFNRAGRLGEVLVVSELNIIPTGPLEEFLNDRLPLPHKAGFKLIATINPPTYPGRSAFPPSLASRFTGVRVISDILNDYRLRLEAMGVSDVLSRWLSECASTINNHLRHKHYPLELTLPEMLRVADQLGKIPVDQWDGYLSWAWGYYLKNCSDSLKLPCIPGQSLTKGSGQSSGTPSAAAKTTELPDIFSMGKLPSASDVFRITRYFPSNWVTNYYRLNLFTVCVTADQRLTRSRLPRHLIVRSNLLFPPPWRSSLQTGETPGRMTLQPGREWQPLPSLTPADRLTGLRTVPEQAQLELAQDQKTGRNFLRSGITEPVTVDFIIKPDLTYFEPLTSGDTIATLPGRCPTVIKVYLDQEVFSSKPTHSSGYRELRQIAGIGNLPKRLLALTDWFGHFSCDRNFTETGLNLVIRLMREKQGTCRHRAFMLQMLCLYWGIEARIVVSDHHSFNEVKCKGGWRLINAGGTSGSHRIYSSEPEWGRLYQSAPAQSVKSPREQGLAGNASGWARILLLAASLCQQYRCPRSKLPQKARDLMNDAVLEEFRNKFCPISFDRGGKCVFHLTSENRYSVDVFDIACFWAPEQYLLAAKHAIDHFSTLAPPEKKAIIDWSHCMLNWAKGYQKPAQHLFAQWAQFAWQLYLTSPGDFPVLPVKSLQSIIRFNYDHQGKAQRICQRLFQVESISRILLEDDCDTLEADDFPLLHKWEKLPLVPVTEVCWSHSFGGRPDLARLIRGEPCFPRQSYFYQEANTLILSAQFLLDRALDTLKQSTNKLTGVPFLDELTDPPFSTVSPDYIGHAEDTRQLIRLIGDKDSVELYTPVICQALEKPRVLIVGNFSDQLTIFESPAGQNFNLIGSGFFSAGITLDCRQSLEKIKGLINEHDAAVVCK